ncbi:regulatory protein RecX [Sphingomonas sp. RS6]
MPSSPRPRPPLDASELERLALRYVERFATTQARLTAYLSRKLRERGWADTSPPDPAAVAAAMAARGYVDDRAFADARVRAMGRRGLGARRVQLALRHDGIREEDSDAVAEAIAEQAVASAVAFARRRRFGPFAAAIPDRAQRDKQFAAMLRAGHSPAIARALLAMSPGDAVEALFEAGQP